MVFGALGDPLTGALVSFDVTIQPGSPAAPMSGFMPGMRRDPSEMTPAPWSGRQAALKSRAVPDTDPRLRECDAALSFWHFKRQIEREVKAGRWPASFGADVEAIFRDMIADEFVAEPETSGLIRIRQSEPGPAIAQAVVSS